MAAVATQAGNGRGSAQMVETGAVPFGAGHALGAAVPVGLDAVLNETARRRMAMLPQNMAELYELAERVARAGWAPQSYRVKPNDDNSPFDVDKIYVSMMHGNEAGLTPLASLQGIAVINGMPSIWGDAAIALVRASGLLEDFEETVEWDGDTPVRARCWAKRKGQPTPVEQIFTRADAQKAFLWTKKGPWTNYPQRMLQMRARAWVLRDTFADVLKGLYIAEEAMDIDTVIAATPSSAARQAAATPAATVPAETFAEALKKPVPQIERYSLFDQHGDQLCEYTNPADWVAALVDLLAEPKRADGRAFLLENNRAVADQISEKHADCTANITAIYAEPEKPADTKPPEEINFDAPANGMQTETPAVDKPAPTPPQRKPVPKFTTAPGDAPTWLKYREKMEAEIRAPDVPDADWITELMTANKDRTAGGPANQQKALRDIATARWRELGGQEDGK